MDSDGDHSDKAENKKKSFHRKYENLKKGRVIVRNLSFKITEEKLKAEFGKFGEITEINLLKKSDGKLVGCAFIQYTNYDDSIKAIKQLNNKEILNRKVTVEFAVSKNRFQHQHPEKIKEVKKEDETDFEIKEEEIKVEESEDEASEKEEEVNEDDSVSGEKEEDNDDDDDSDNNENEEEEDVKPDIKPSKYDQDDSEYTIFIKNLSYDTTDENLQTFFKKYGPIKYALVVKDKVSGHSKGTGFVRFLKKESVSMCLQQSGSIVLQNFNLDILPSIPKKEIQSLEKQLKQTEPKDNRHLYLLKEGTIIAGSKAAEGVSATDMSKRLRLEQIKTQMLKNLNRFISSERLTIHNIPEAYDDKKLRKMVVKWTNLNPKECRVMRENKPSPGFPQGRSKGFGFLSFKKHEDALAVLRKLNNNPSVFSASHRPIVSFSIEDKKVHNIKQKRQERSLKNNPTYQKKMEKIKMKKAKKLKEKIEAKMNQGNKKLFVKPKVDVEDDVDVDEYAGVTSKPGQTLKIRGTFKLKQQSMIHEKTTTKKKKELRKQKEINEIKKEKQENRQDRKLMKRKRTEEIDNLSSKIEKYKKMIQGAGGGDDVQPSKRARGKWYIE